MKSESDLRIEIMLLLCPGLMQRWNQLKRHSADSKLRPLLNVAAEVLMSLSEVESGFINQKLWKWKVKVIWEYDKPKSDLKLGVMLLLCPGWCKGETSCSNIL